MKQKPEYHGQQVGYGGIGLSMMLGRALLFFLTQVSQVPNASKTQNVSMLVSECLFDFAHTNSNWKWPFIVDFPIKNGDFPLLC